MFHVHSVFETTIRYLGASLSAYELTGKKFPVLITKAKQVADKLSVAWVGVRSISPCSLFSSPCAGKSCMEFWKEKGC